MARHHGNDPTDDAAALAAVAAHHAHMLERAEALAEALLAAIEAGDGARAYDEKANLVGWCEDDLIPHTTAEERYLYGPVREAVEARLLVGALLLDHQATAGVVEELRAARGPRAAALGLVIARSFALHVRTGDELLLPLIAQDIARNAGFSLADAVAGLEELVG